MPISTPAAHAARSPFSSQPDEGEQFPARGRKTARFGEALWVVGIIDGRLVDGIEAETGVREGCFQLAQYVPSIRSIRRQEYACQAGGVGLFHPVAPALQFRQQD